MPARKHVHARQLLALMEEALDVCIRLRDFSEEKRGMFSGGDDARILDTVRERESMINQLIGVEYKVDLILDEVDDYKGGGALPPEVEEVRRNIRSVLSTVTELDLAALQLIGARMQTYKTKTLKARNKKHLSAYVRANRDIPSPTSFDYKK